MTTAARTVRPSPSSFAGVPSIMSLPACLRLPSLALLLVLASCGKPEVSTAPAAAAPDPNTVLLGELQLDFSDSLVGQAVPVLTDHPTCAWCW